MRPGHVSAVVCSLNSISGIGRCLRSLRDAGVGELVVVDAHSSDGTRQIADRLADRVVEDPGSGLGNARNVGIAETTLPLILNMGSDNVMPPGQLQVMIDSLEQGHFHGVSARTRIEGTDYVTRGLNAWRTGRFVPGPAAVIGTPTLFLGDLLREHRYDPNRVFSDDSELCERWTTTMGSSFAISDAMVSEVGKATWDEVITRCRMYGISDYEVFNEGRAKGWTLRRKVRSLTHPLREDLLRPVTRLPPQEALATLPFLGVFTTLRYAAWLKRATEGLRRVS